MSKDIGPILRGWDYAHGELSVRIIEDRGGAPKIQIRMDLGLMQLEWQGRPDGTQPHDHPSLLEFYQAQYRGRQEAGGAFSLSREACWALGQEAIQYYWRRISFFELKEYLRAEGDAVHNLGILDLCQEFAENEEDRRIAEQYRVFVTAHRIQARALALLEEKDHDAALEQIRSGIGEIERILEDQGDFAEMEECPELRFLMEWEKEVEENRPLSPREKLHADLKAAVEEEKFELAAALRDKLRTLEAKKPYRRQDL